MLPTVFHIITFRPVLCQSFLNKNKLQFAKPSNILPHLTQKINFSYKRLIVYLQFLQPYNIINIPDKTISNSSTLSTTPYRCLRQGYIEIVDLLSANCINSRYRQNICGKICTFLLIYCRQELFAKTPKSNFNSKI